MANSTSHIDTIIATQYNRELTSNSFMDAASPATLYGRRESTSSGLTWGYYGGVVRVAGVHTLIANGTLTLTASGTRYIEADPSTGAVSFNTTAFTAGSIPLYTVVVGTATVTNYTDHRAFVVQAGYASADQAQVTGTATGTDAAMINGEIKVLLNEIRGVLIDAGLIKGGA